MPGWQAERDAALLALERAKKREERVNAARTLVRLAVEDGARGPVLAGHLPRLLDDRDVRVRRAGVALAAAALPVEEAEPFLTGRVADPEYEVRLEAVGQLADLARPSSRGAFAAALEDPALEVRFEAARGMAALQHTAGLEVLVEGLSWDHLRFRALGALAELGDPRAKAPIEKVFGRWLLPSFERTQAAGALVRLGDPSKVAYLLTRSRKKWSTDRALAVELLGEVKAEGARARLAEILRDKKDTCRGAAARGLGRLGDLGAAEDLAAVLEAEDTPEDVLLDAAEGLCLLGGASARAKVEAAVERAQDPALKEELRTMLEDYP